MTPSQTKLLTSITLSLRQAFFPDDFVERPAKDPMAFMSGRRLANARLYMLLLTLFPLQSVLLEKVVPYPGERAGM